MAEQRKIKRAALALMGAIVLLLVALAVNAARMAVSDGLIWSAATITHFIVGLVFNLVTLGVALLLLASVRRAESPFTRKHVGLLKTIAVLLIVVEPYHFAANQILRTLAPMVLEGGLKVEVSASLSGVMLAAGFVVYCVALIFQYGISLQEQVDETL